MIKKLTSILVASALVGCASNGIKLVDVPDKKMKEYLEDKPDELHDHYSNLLIEGERNAVLNHMRTSLAAYELGEKKLAKAGFDKAIHSIESIYTNTDSARKARRTFVAEKAKNFKGEAYERALVYYYRGLIFLEDNDFENARASFQSALLQDTLAENETYSADLSSMEWLAGWSAHCSSLAKNGNDRFDTIASDHFKRAANNNTLLEPPYFKDNVLVVVETGTSPKKIASDRGVEFLAYARGDTEKRKPKIKVEGEYEHLIQAEDIFWQASTRGGRHVDVVNAGKAEFKRSAQSTSASAAAVASGGLTMAETLLDIGATSGEYSEDLLNAAGAASVIGLLGGIVSGASALAADAAKPEADLRYWDNLPNMIYLSSYKAEDLGEMVSVITTNGKKEFPLDTASNDVCEVIWERDGSTTRIPVIHPNAR